MPRSIFHGAWLELIRNLCMDEFRGKRTFIIFIFTRKATYNITNTTGNVNERPLLAKRKTGCHRQGEADCLCEQGTATKVTMDNKPLKTMIEFHGKKLYMTLTRQYCFDFWDTTTGSLCVIRRIHLRQRKFAVLT